MKSYPIPEQLLVAAVSLLERLPATKDVRAVLNALETVVAQHDNAQADALIAQARQQAGTMGGGGPGEEQPPKKPV